MNLKNMMYINPKRIQELAEAKKRRINAIRAEKQLGKAILAQRNSERALKLSYQANRVQQLERDYLDSYRQAETLRKDSHSEVSLNLLMPKPLKQLPLPVPPLQPVSSTPTSPPAVEPLVLSPPCESSTPPPDPRKPSPQPSTKPPIKSSHRSSLESMPRTHRKHLSPPFLLRSISSKPIAVHILGENRRTKLRSNEKSDPYLQYPHVFREYAYEVPEKPDSDRLKRIRDFYTKRVKAAFQPTPSLNKSIELTRAQSRVDERRLRSVRKVKISELIPL